MPGKEVYPHVQAAFINAIREEGTKQDACDWLQKQWNETWALKRRLSDVKAERSELQGDLNDAAATVNALAVHVERLREALKMWSDAVISVNAKMDGPEPVLSPRKARSAYQAMCEALVATPEQSLAEHDKRVRREALKRAMVICGTLAERPFDNEPEHSAVLHCEAAIRNLMEQEQDDG